MTRGGLFSPFCDVGCISAISRTKGKYKIIVSCIRFKWPAVAVQELYTVNKKFE